MRFNATNRGEVFSVQLDGITGTDFIRSSVIMFFIGSEGIYIIENLGVMGVPFPPMILNAFELLKSKNEEKTIN